ncbi:Putative hydrolase [Seminavis robusta]|uniref:Hydrolase n=1 Tax=Seminavis robusta TaxID=568900 RepID=A0A9N8DJX5_9STRA|nr:Putative hydrolase [Seminavis robusta]|eukprot:Sro184_g079990.1 Putative hydrolase (725) ;mRNA; r:53220-55394
MCNHQGVGVATATTSADHQKGAAAAFFDFDKTLVAKDSQLLEGQDVLLARHLTNPCVIAGLLGCFMLEPIVNRGWANADLLGRMYLSSYRGIRHTSLIESARWLYHKRIKLMVYREMIEILNDHRRKGHMIIIVSATSEHLLKPFAEDFNVDAWLATSIQCDQHGICTGRPAGSILCGVEKAKAIQELAEECSIDLSSSWAYSDHHEDLAFLQSVGNPVAINPTPKLQQIAQEEQWEMKFLQLPETGKVSSDHAGNPRKGDRRGHQWLKMFLVLSLMAASALRAFTAQPELYSAPETPGVTHNKGSTMQRLCVISSEPLTYVQTVSGSIVAYRQLIAGALARGTNVLVVEPLLRDEVVPIAFPNNGTGSLEILRLPVQKSNELDRGGLAAFDPRAFRNEMRQHILIFGADVILIPDPIVLMADMMMIAPGHYEARELGAALVYDIHTNLVDLIPMFNPWTGLPLVQRALHWLHKEMLKYANTVLVISEQQEKHLRDETGYKGPVQIAPAGVPNMCATTRSQNFSPSTIIGSHCEVTFTWVGRLAKEKHIREILDAMARLLKDNGSWQNTCLAVAGPDQGELSVLQHYVREHPKNIFYMGTLEQSEVGTLLQASDAMLFVGGVIETLARVVTDALSCHTPVIAVATPQSSWWQNREDLPHVDLTVSSDAAKELKDRMVAFTTNAGGLRDALVAGAAHSAPNQISEKEAIAHKLMTLDSVYDGLSG